MACLVFRCSVIYFGVYLKVIIDIMLTFYFSADPYLNWGASDVWPSK